jgi:hypothetical protein
MPRYASGLQIKNFSSGIVPTSRLPRVEIKSVVSGSVQRETLPVGAVFEMQSILRSGLVSWFGERNGMRRCADDLDRISIDKPACG